MIMEKVVFNVRSNKHENNEWAAKWAEDNGFNRIIIENRGNNHHIELTLPKEDALKYEAGKDYMITIEEI